MVSHRVVVYVVVVFMLYDDDDEKKKKKKKKKKGVVVVECDERRWWMRRRCLARAWERTRQSRLINKRRGLQTVGRSPNFDYWRVVCRFDGVFGHCHRCFCG